MIACSSWVLITQRLAWRKADQTRPVAREIGFSRDVTDQQNKGKDYWIDEMPS